MRNLGRLAVLIVILGAIGVAMRLNLGPGVAPSGSPASSSETADGRTSSPFPGGTVGTTATPAQTPLSTLVPTPSSTAAEGWPSVGHIFEIVFENHEATGIIGNVSKAPYLNSLISVYGLATNYTAVAKPSQPNYLALFAGSTLGVTDNGTHDLTAPNLADQIESSGRDWRVAAQNYPLGCFTGSSALGGADGSGTYARKHNPAISFTQISGTPARCAKITDLAHFNPAIGDYWMIIPNMCNSMHDCSIKTGDSWLAGFLPTILESPAFKADGLIVITFDEGSTSIGGGGKVVTIFISPSGRTTFSSPTAHTHYSLLRTFEELWGMPCLAESCSANTMQEFFR